MCRDIGTTQCIKMMQKSLICLLKGGNYPCFVYKMGRILAKVSCCMGRNWQNQNKNKFSRLQILILIFGGKIQIPLIRK